MHPLKWLTLVGLLFVGFVSPTPVAASTITHQVGQSAQVFGVAQEDLDGDGEPDVTIIDSSFATADDRVLVYDRSGNMRPGSRWEDMTDFDDDIWIFDVGADGAARLIIAFAHEGGNQVAYLYLDENEDGQVSYEVTGKGVRITESPHWRLKIAARGSWLLSDGRPNPHVAISIDGITQSLLDSYVGLTKGWLEFNTDGQVDWEIESADQDADGEADYVLTRLQTDVPDYFSAFRSSLTVDRDPRPAQAGTAPIFWYFLFGAEGANGFAKSPAVVLDWETGTVHAAGVQGFLSEQSYYILSSAPSWQKGQINDVLWENPVAYYDLAGDRDGHSEMYIRVVQPLWLNANPNRPLTPDQLTVQYFWDQHDDRQYEYRVTVAGRRPITHTIELADLAVRTVPYETLPAWVLDHEWDAAFLLVGEDGGQGGGEGLMWVWENWNAPATDYLSGYADQVPPTPLREIEVGYRGEYSLEYAKQPVLYFSPLDQRLHLRAAQDGVWNLGGGHHLRYANLDGDAYLDQWQEERDGSVLQQVTYSDGIYVYSGSGTVQIQQNDLGPSLFEVKPPKDKTGWQSLDAQLTANRTALSAEDFAGMLDRLAGKATRVEGALLRDYRITPQGFRFVLELQDGFSAEHEQNDLLPLPQAPGSYVVSYTGGAWSVQLATPAALRVAELQVTSSAGSPRALDWSTVEAHVRNDGLEDVHDLPVCLTLDDPIGRRTVMTDTVALLPGEGEQHVAWDWVPATAGSWQIQIVTNCYDSEGMASGGKLLKEATVEVSDSETPSASWLISLGGHIPESIVLFLFATVAIAGLTVVLWMREPVS